MLSGKIGSSVARVESDASAAASPEIASDLTLETEGARRRAIYVISALTLANTLNHLDRQIVSILAEPIKLEFSLADWELGILTGLSFALLYGIASFPLAHLADRTNRARVISTCLALWSLFTALGGIAQSYAQLLASRVLVGVAEAGGAAPSQSLIADMTPRNNRATALALFSIGIPLGSFLGMTMGGILADSHGWRMGMILAGLPGIALAVLLAFTLRDPRGKPGTKSRDVLGNGTPRLSITSFLYDVRTVFRVRSFRYITFGGACISFVNYSQSAFLASFFFRSYSEELNRITAAELAVVGLSFGASAFLGLVLGAAKGIPGVIGTLWGGRLTDRLADRTLESFATLPAVATWLRIPLIVGVLLAPSLELALVFVVLQAFVIGIAAPAGFASVQGLVHPSSRAMAASIYLFALNVVGLGLGPLTVGFFSDYLQFSGMTTGEGLRWALLSSGIVILALGGWLKWRAKDSIAKEMVS